MESPVYIAQQPNGGWRSKLLSQLHHWAGVVRNRRQWRLIHDKGKNMKIYKAKISYDLVREVENPERITNDSAAAEALRSVLLSDPMCESFACCFLNVKNQILGVYKVSEGGRSSAIVDIPKLLKAAILSGCPGIIVGHNHPSGDLEPSQDDLKITDRIKNAAKIVEINFLDHLIITENKHLSLINYN